MGDGVPPLVESLQFDPPVLVPHVVGLDPVPEFDAQKAEVGTETARLGILTVELSTLRETGLDQMPDQCRRVDERHQPGHAFGMEVATEALELRRDEHRVCVIDLLGRISPTTPGAPDGGVGDLDLVQLAGPRRQPDPLGLRRHEWPVSSRRC